MFQYTTETIINSNEGHLDGKVRFGVFEAGAAKFFVVDGVNTFKLPKDEKDPIKICAYHSPWREAKPATATLTIPASMTVDLKDGNHTVTDGDVLRLTVVIREQGSTRSTIQNAYRVRTKPFHYEIMVASTDAAGKNQTIAQQFAKLITKDMRDTDFGYFTIDADGEVLTADDCYIQFEDVTLDYVLDSNHLTGITPTKPIKEFKKEIKAGDQGAGTVARIIKDLRIPTSASINPFGADHGGMPVPGGKYDQYTIEYETPRAHVAGGVVGSVGEVSRTTHVFFIEAGAKTAWDNALTDAGITPTEARENVATTAADGVKAGELSKHKAEKGSVQ